jgi:superfamily II DNA or RNA helicase
MKLIKRTIIDKPETTYNLHIENDHNYVANGAVVSNCHGAKAKELKELLCGPMANIPLRWGMTGTVPKEDYQFASVLAGIGAVMIEIPSEELIEKDVLAKCKIDIVQLQLQKTMGYFADWDCEKKYLNTNPDIMRWLADFTQTVTENGSTLLLVENIETGKMLELMIPDSKFVYGNVSVDDRKVEYKKVDNSKNNVLIATYGVAAVGINMTFLYNVILYNSGKSPTKILQSVGRGLRRGESELVDMKKTSVQIYDVCSDLKYSKRHLSLRKSYYKEEKFPFTLTKVVLV